MSGVAGQTAEVLTRTSLQRSRAPAYGRRAGGLHRRLGRGRRRRRAVPLPGRRLHLDPGRALRGLALRHQRLPPGRGHRLAALLRRPVRLRPAARAARRLAVQRPHAAPDPRRRVPLRRPGADRLAAGAALRSRGAAVVRPRRLGRLPDPLLRRLLDRRLALVAGPAPLPSFPQHGPDPDRGRLRHLSALPRGAAMAGQRRRQPWASRSASSARSGASSGSARLRRSGRRAAPSPTRSRRFPRCTPPTRC